MLQPISIPESGIYLYETANACKHNIHVIKHNEYISAGFKNGKNKKGINNPYVK